MRIAYVQCVFLITERGSSMLWLFHNSMCIRMISMPTTCLGWPRNSPAWIRVPLGGKSICKIWWHYTDIPAKCVELYISHRPRWPRMTHTSPHLASPLCIIPSQSHSHCTQFHSTLPISAHQIPSNFITFLNQVFSTSLSLYPLQFELEFGLNWILVWTKSWFCTERCSRSTATCM